MQLLLTISGILVCIGVLGCHGGGLLITIHLRFLKSVHVVSSLALHCIGHHWIAAIELGLRTRWHHSLVVLIHLVLHDLDVIGQRLVRLP